MTTTLTGSPNTALVTPDDIGLRITKTRYTLTHTGSAAGKHYSARAGFVFDPCAYLATGAYAPPAAGAHYRATATIDSMDLRLARPNGAVSAVLSIREVGLSNEIAVSAPFALGTSEDTVHITFPSKPQLPVSSGRKYDFWFKTADLTGVYSDVTIFVDPSYGVSGFGVFDSVHNIAEPSGQFLRGSMTITVTEEFNVGTPDLVDAVDLATALLGRNSAYTLWEEPLSSTAAGSQSGGSNTIHFTPSAFGAASACAVRMVKVKVTGNAGQLPMCPVYAWIVKRDNPTVPLAISEPVYIGATVQGVGAWYTFLFPAAVPLAVNGEYSLLFMSGRTGKAFPVYIGMRLSDSTVSDPAIYYAAAAQYKPQLKVLFSDTSVAPLTGITAAAASGA